MKIEFDLKKNLANIEQRGICFSTVVNFDFENALEVIQDVNGEIRYFALGTIHKRLYALVYTLRGDCVLRVISLRKANKREVILYEKAF
ncbi:MAG: BrnT family toxin [Pelistega sp.]|nr:BrnT family toxin [Pelistega sp.]